MSTAATVFVMSEETEDRERRQAAVERELQRTREPGDERDLVDTVGEEQRRERAREDEREDGED